MLRSIVSNSCLSMLIVWTNRTTHPQIMAFVAQLCASHPFLLCITWDTHMGPLKSFASKQGGRLNLDPAAERLSAVPRSRVQACKCTHAFSENSARVPMKFLRRLELAFERRSCVGVSTSIRGEKEWFRTFPSRNLPSRYFRSSE